MSGSYSVRRVLGPGGEVSRRLQGYEVRPQQLEMAEMIERVIGDGGDAVIEAGTGTGKSLGYLVPTILAGKTVNVSTSGKALQDQLSKKDVPFLVETLPVQFTYAVLKGRSNYACLARVDRLRDNLSQALSTEFAFKSDAAGLAWPAVDSWIGQEEASEGAGDLEGLPMALPSELQGSITIASEECTGKRCPAFDRCFVERAKKKAKAAQVRIVNHHLLLLDLHMRAGTGGHASLLPDADVLTIDEAHTLEEIATKVFTTEVTADRVTYLVGQVDNLTSRHPAAKTEGTEEHDTAKEWHDRVREIGGLIGRGFVEIDGRLIRADVGVQRLGDERPILEPAASATREYAGQMAQGTPFWLDDDERERWKKLVEQMVGLADDLDAVAWSEPDADAVRYAEAEGEDEKRKLTLCRAPIDVAPLLRERLWGMRKREEDDEDEYDPSTGSDDPLEDAFSDVEDRGVKVSVIACSATIAAGGDMRFWRDRVGAPMETKELIVGSPFNYRRHSLLYLPDRSIADQLDPSKRDAEQSAAYISRLSEEILSLIRLSDGRAFVLFTSVRALRAVHARLSPELGQYLVLKQGEMPRAELVKRFKEHGRAVLFATKSFWEGVDVAGDALSMVIIDKLPFTAPDDPIWEARKDAVTRRALARGMAPDRARWAWWTELALPTATIALKQGVGRLIRTQADRGVCAILDGRVTLKPYGAGIVRSLPPMTPTSSLELVGQFFDKRLIDQSA
jgi:ATP-dependent DNA helicase DinG